MTKILKIWSISNQCLSSKPLQRVAALVVTGIFIALGLLTLLDRLSFRTDFTQLLRPSIYVTSKTNRHTDTESELYDPVCPDVTNYDVSDLIPKKKLTKYEPVCDRIHLQSNHIPKSYQRALDNDLEIPMKIIYLSGGERTWYMKDGQTYFIQEKCPVNRCVFTYDRNQGPTADAVVFSNPFSMPFTPPWPRKSCNQIWAMSTLEVPHNTRSVVRYANFFNWTMTYRRDSTIVTPYFKFMYFKTPLSQGVVRTNYGEGKTKQVAWMVSNCRLVQSGRMSYAKELTKHISVDVYGACGTKSCRKGEMKKCLKMIKTNYKFYLAFENAKCLNYFTEKIPQNALRNNAIPIILGVSREEMKAVAPPGSFIHVEDFESPKELAKFLKKIDEDDNLFNQYFEWKRYGKMVSTKTFCRFCAMLHEPELPDVTQHDISDWWKGSCIGARNWNAQAS